MSRTQKYSKSPLHFHHPKAENFKTHYSGQSIALRALAALAEVSVQFPAPNTEQLPAPWEPMPHSVFLEHPAALASRTNNQAYTYSINTSIKENEMMNFRN